MKKINIVLLCVVMIGMLFMIGCAQGSGSNQNAGSTASSGEKGASEAGGQQNSEEPEKVTLRFAWWGGQERHKATLEAINAYMAKNPHVEIQAEYGEFQGYYEKLTAQLTGGTAPDIFQIVDRWFFDLGNEKELLVDLNTVESIDFSGVDQAFKESQSFQGRALGFPAGLQGSVLMFNKDLLAQHNIPLDTKWTWDNIIEVGKKVREQSGNQYFLSTDTGELSTFLRAYAKQLTGEQWIKDDFTIGFTKEDATKMLTFVKDVMEQGVAEPLNQANVYLNKSNENPKWLAGELGVQYKYISLIPNYQKGISFEIGSAQLPEMPNSKDTGVYTGSTSLFALNSKSKHVEESAKFLNWLVNDEEAIKILGITRGIPTTSEGRRILGEANLIDPVVAEAMEIALKTATKITDNAISQNTEFDVILKETIDKVAFGVSTPEAAAEELIKLYELRLKEMKN